MKTEFNSTPFVLIVFLFIASGMTLYFLCKGPGFGTLQLPFFILAGCFAAEAGFAVLYPMVSFYRIEITGGALVYTWLFPRRARKVYLHEIKGYYSVLLPSRDAEYMTFYPVVNMRPLPPVSSFIFSNSGTFMQKTGLEHLGRLRFSWKLYFWNIHLKKRLA